MKKGIIKQFTNLLRTRNKEYESNFTVNSVESSILLGSLINVPNDSINSASLIRVMSHIIIRFTDVDKSMIDEIDKFSKLCVNSSINTLCDSDDDNGTFNMTIASNYSRLAHLVRGGRDDNTLSPDNYFLDAINTYLSYFLDNRFGYQNDELSYELVENPHRSFRRKYDEYIKRSNLNPIEILGYSWIVDDEELDDINTSINCIWISIDQSILNEFVEMPSYSYPDNGRVLMKINLNEFLIEMNMQISSISEETFKTIKLIMESDIKYFRYIYELINWNRFKYSVNEYQLLDNYKSEEQKEEEPQEDFINKLIDEVIK